MYPLLGKLPKEGVRGGNMVFPTMQGGKQAARRTVEQPTAKRRERSILPPAASGDGEAGLRPARAVDVRGREAVDVPVALLGYGTVGSAVNRLLSENAEDI